MQIYVYHYTSAQNAIAILSELSLKLSTLAACNDPRESKDFSFGMTITKNKQPRDSLGKPLDLSAVSFEASQLIKNDWRVLCVTGDSEGDRHPLGVGPTIAPMWAHYADKHRGVCLILRYAELDEEISRTAAKLGMIKGAVRYDGSWGGRAFMLNGEDIFENGLETAVRKHVIEHYEALFLAKNSSWSYERELRWLIRSPSEVRVSIASGIRGVVLGVDCPEKDCERFDELGRALGIDVGVMSWRNGIAWPVYGGRYIPGVSRTFRGD